MKIFNAVNETLEISDRQWQELLDMSVIDVILETSFQKTPYYDTAEETNPRYVCWTFLAMEFGF